jgi:flagellar basal-body rod protein FlgB
MDNQIFPYLESLLNLTARRQQALASNVANIDTPGYKAKDVAFEQELASTLRMAATESGHLNVSPASTGTRFIEAKGQMKPNGNTVDIETQMTELTKNGLQYVTLVQYLNQKLRTIRTSINEGGR